MEYRGIGFNYKYLQSFQHTLLQLLQHSLIKAEGVLGHPIERSMLASNKQIAALLFDELRLQHPYASSSSSMPKCIK